MYAVADPVGGTWGGGGGGGGGGSPLYSRDVARCSFFQLSECSFATHRSDLKRSVMKRAKQSPIIAKGHIVIYT